MDEVAQRNLEKARKKHPHETYVCIKYFNDTTYSILHTKYIHSFDFRREQKVIPIFFFSTSL